MMIGFFLLSKMTVRFSAEILKTNKNVEFLLRTVKHNLTKQITRWEIRRKLSAKTLLCGTLYQNFTRKLPISHNQFIERDGRDRRFHGWAATNCSCCYLICVDIEIWILSRENIKDFNKQTLNVSKVR